MGLAATSATVSGGVMGVTLTQAEQQKQSSMCGD
jgi:hypothetical protein